MKTAIEWFYETIINDPLGDWEYYFKKAKEIEKQQIELAFLMGCLKISVNTGVITTPPPKPEKAVIMPAINPVMPKEKGLLFPWSEPITDGFVKYILPTINKSMLAKT